MNSSEKQTFGKDERLCSTKLIYEIFEKGNSFYTSNFKVIWMITTLPLSSPSQIAISVPKKVIKLAVTRNLIKRRIREAYRRNKHALYRILDSEKNHLVFILIYNKHFALDYPVIEKSVAEVIARLCDSILR